VPSPVQFSAETAKDVTAMSDWWRCNEVTADKELTSTAEVFADNRTVTQQNINRLPCHP
jgi:hypothetical protein